MTMDIAKINLLPECDFITVFGNIVENFNKCAISLCKNRPYADKQSLLDAAFSFIDNLDGTDVENVLRAHPDLVGQLADESSLTTESQGEQRSAGLREISANDSADLAKLNNEYKAKFNFPFIICARENKFDSILRGLRERILNEREFEKVTALEEVKKITFYRVNNLFLQ